MLGRHRDCTTIVMFQLLGKLVVRIWPIIFALWVLVPIALSRVAPKWEDVAAGSQFESLPPDSPSNRSKELFKKAFPNELPGSSVAIVLVREAGPLRDEDRLL